MLPDDGFLAQLRDRPDDEALRLVYADWLDDRGDPRGEYLRLDARLTALPETDAEHPRLKARLAELAAGIDVRWRADAGRVFVESGPPFAHPRRHPLNVPGPFYTTGDCLWCGAPETQAPDLLAPLANRNGITHFVRQPETADEVERACSACRVCCVAALRYGGTDPLVIRRLGNDPTYCDYTIADDKEALAPAEQAHAPTAQAPIPAAWDAPTQQMTVDSAGVRLRRQFVSWLALRVIVVLYGMFSLLVSCLVTRYVLPDRPLWVFTTLFIAIFHLVPLAVLGVIVLSRGSPPRRSGG
jgi:uncharacterized protein (TIGR02996 family)